MSGIVGSKINIRGSGRIAKLGTDGQVLTSSGAGKTANYEDAGTYDDTGIRSDIMTLALKQASQENMTKHNLPNSAIVVFQADADFDLSGSTDVTRNDSEYIEATTTTTVAFSNDSNTLLLLHFDGADGATSTSDASDSGHGITFNGNAQLDTAIKKIGTASCLFDGTGDLLDITGTLGDFNHGTSDWTYEAWVYSDSFASTLKALFAQGTHDAAGEMALRVNTDSNFAMELMNSGAAAVRITGSTTISTGAWHHLAITKQTSDTLIRGYIDGVQEGTVASPLSYGSTTELHIGQLPGYTNYWDGNIDEFRVSDTCRYPDGTTFTPNGSTAVNATGTALGTTNVPSSAVTEVSGVLLMKNAYGTNTLGTDVTVYFTADNSNWTEASSYTSAGTFSTGVTQITLGKTTVTSGSDVRWKIVFANQSDSSKVAYIYGIGTNY